MPLQDFGIKGYDYLQKKAKKQSESASVIYLPANWVGKKVAVILLEPVEGSETSACTK